MKNIKKLIAVLVALAFAACLLTACGEDKKATETTVAETVAETTAAETVAETTAAETVEETTAAETVEETTAAETVEETTAVEETIEETVVEETVAAETVEETTVAETVEETTVAETVEETTVAETVEETTVAETVEETTVAETVAETKADDAEAVKYVIATDMGFAPFEFQDEDANIVGIDMDIIRAIAEDQGFEIEIQYIGWDAAIAACQAGQADAMIAGASITDARKDSGWIFSDGYYNATQGMAVAANSKIAKFEDLKGKTVAVKNGTMSDEYATGLAEEYGFTVQRFDTSPDMYQAVIGGQCAACFDDTPILKYNIKSNELPLKFVDGTENEPAEYGMAAFSEDEQELIDMFNAGLANIKEDGTYDEIIATYLGE